VPENASADELLTVEDLAGWLKVKPAWVRAHANGNRKPELPSLKMGAYRRFRRQDIQAFLEQLAKRAR
jgi:helix-turn-helix protein